MPITAPTFRAEEEAAKPYDRELYSRLAAKAGMTIYRRQHIQKLVQMVAKAVGADPHGRLANWGERPALADDAAQGRCAA